MERIIVLNQFDSICVDELSVNDIEGIIIIYEKNKVIGSIVPDWSKDEWLFVTINDQYSDPFLPKIIQNHPEYTFKYID